MEKEEEARLVLFAFTEGCADGVLLDELCRAAGYECIVEGPDSNSLGGWRGVLDRAARRSVEGEPLALPVIAAVDADYDLDTKLSYLKRTLEDLLGQPGKVEVERLQKRKPLPSWIYRYKDLDLVQLLAWCRDPWNSSCVGTIEDLLATAVSKYYGCDADVAKNIGDCIVRVLRSCRGCGNVRKLVRSADKLSPHIALLACTGSTTLIYAGPGCMEALRGALRGVAHGSQALRAYVDALKP